MDLFSRTNLKADPAKVKQVKTWIAEILNLDEQVTISLNQLTCHEPGCPPIETAIVIMKQPPKQYKIHKSIAEIERTDIERLIEI
ncbi:conserved hypothetical protein [Hyella patelloides LEGE 07179]|uniref:Nitrate reductase n=1 Tax=Hyella patelloides LEGE 07179 TaxID=945734 RepID=A0A563VN26_9CYAN|nr:hypothetical protein [Hyella patelloides]VEP12828.1 conserved hypothetical protein [Hyella patelloides LEGE 07179]